MIKKLYDKCIEWAGHKHAKIYLAIESFAESSFFACSCAMDCIFSRLRKFSYSE